MNKQYEYIQRGHLVRDRYNCDNGEQRKTTTATTKKKEVPKPGIEPGSTVNSKHYTVDKRHVLMKDSHTSHYTI